LTAKNSTVRHPLAWPLEKVFFDTRIFNRLEIKGANHLGKRVGRDLWIQDSLNSLGATLPFTG
jgi:hypothetical protein